MRNPRSRAGAAGFIGRAPRGGDRCAASDLPVLRRDDPVLPSDLPVLRRGGCVLARGIPVLRRDDPVLPSDLPVLRRDGPALARDVPVLVRCIPALAPHDGSSPHGVRPAPRVRHGSRGIDQWERRTKPVLSAAGERPHAADPSPEACLDAFHSSLDTHRSDLRAVLWIGSGPVEFRSPEIALARTHGGPSQGALEHRGCCVTQAADAPTVAKPPDRCHVDATPPGSVPLRRHLLDSKGAFITDRASIIRSLNRTGATTGPQPLMESVIYSR
jgi:hypothetical protein